MVHYDAVRPAGTIPGTRLDVDLRRLPWVRPLASDYVADFASVSEFFAGNPWAPESWREVIGRVQAFGRDRDGIARVLGAQAERRGAPPAARQAIAQLQDPRTVAVVTGQQAGLFGGPLYTLLKAITALQLAAQARETHGVPAVALFWVDAEDHDWDEVKSCPVLSADLELRTIALGSPEGAGEVPVAALRLGPEIEGAIGELERALQPTEYTEEVIRALRETYRPGVGMAEAFARWLDRVLGPLGLVVFESADPAAKPLVSGLFTRVLSDPGHVGRLAAESGEAMRHKGHEPQVVPQADAVALFRLNGGRRAIRVRDGQFLVEDQLVAREKLVADAASAPHTFSPNVLLRPIVQDSLFPTVAYVSGPSELAYLGQLKQVYERFGVPMPLIYPRASVTLLDSASTRFLARYEFPFEDLRQQDESALNRLLEAQLPARVEASLLEAETAVQRGMAHVIDAVAQIDPTLSGAARTTLGRMEHDLRTLHGKIIQAAKKRDETLRRQFSRAQALAFPGGHPQERTLGLPFFLNRYGWGLVKRLEAELPLDTGRHWVMTI
jgi:bacillithiol biosynthesis cysteine-adding enzyme BshC